MAKSEPSDVLGTQMQFFSGFLSFLTTFQSDFFVVHKKSNRRSGLTPMARSREPPAGLSRQPKTASKALKFQMGKCKQGQIQL